MLDVVRSPCMIVVECSLASAVPMDVIKSSKRKEFSFD